MWGGVTRTQKASAFPHPARGPDPGGGGTAAWALSPRTLHSKGSEAELPSLWPLPRVLFQDRPNAEMLVFM